MITVVKTKMLKLRASIIRNIYKFLLRTKNVVTLSSTKMFH